MESGTVVQMYPERRETAEQRYILRTAGEGEDLIALKHYSANTPPERLVMRLESLGIPPTLAIR